MPTLTQTPPDLGKHTHTHTASGHRTVASLCGPDLYGFFSPSPTQTPILHASTFLSSIAPYNMQQKGGKNEYRRRMCLLVSE